MALAQEKCRNEVFALLNRWVEESDLDDEQILEAVTDAINKWNSNAVIEFRPDEELEDGLDLGEAEEGG
tara:strand:- start:265 stop:471 length:207 start_codon:yes stop_codon:yes gene_type:complete